MNKLQTIVTMICSVITAYAAWKSTRRVQEKRRIRKAIAEKERLPQ